MKSHSLIFPLTLIAAGVIWLLVSMNVIPSANLWALTHIWPYVLIALGVGLIVRSYSQAAGSVVSALVVVGAVMAVLYAPRLGWADAPGWEFDADFGGGAAGSGRVETETRTLKNFLAVSLEYPAEVIVQQGPSESVKLEADDNLLPQLSTEIRDGTLYIENSERDWSKRVDPSETVKITITVKDLHEIDFSSAGTLRVDGLKTEEFSLVLSGAGNVTLNKLDVDKLASVLSGAGNITANGSADEMKLTISGFGDFEAKDLKTLSADIHISGAGSADVSVENELAATVSGAGSINYYGSPSVDQNISGAGSVNQAGK